MFSKSLFTRFTRISNSSGSSRPEIKKGHLSEFKRGHFSGTLKSVWGGGSDGDTLYVCSGHHQTIRSTKIISNGRFQFYTPVLA